MADNGEDPRYQKHTVRPPLLKSGKQSHKIMRSKSLSLTVQVVAEGGETNMHAHSNIDSIWYVLSGQATFYGEHEKVLAVLNPNECLFTEHGSPYWFESSQPGNLVLQHFSAIVPGIKPERIDYQERKYVIDNVGYDVVGDAAKGMTDRPVEVVAGKFFGD
jgi:mannose-6-phosphate isomerase-like protein (cupin superfamily)